MKKHTSNFLPESQHAIRGLRTSFRQMAQFAVVLTIGISSPCPAETASSGFAVNNQNRNDVIAFWHAVYQASEGYENRIGWTGNYKGTPGKTSSAFANDVERRLNYFRAMCGVPANVQVNSGSKVVIDPGDLAPNKPASSTLKSVAAQQAALMLVRNFNPQTGMNPAMTHNAPASLVGWSAAAWNASARGNITLGYFGPGAITEYILENPIEGASVSSWNSEVGHRRWCLYPPATDFATGDQPGESALLPPTNVLYVIQSPKEVSKSAADRFVSYPPAGFFPAPINSEFWSVSRSNADFTNAKVSMKTRDGKPIPVSNIKKNAGFGDPAIVWQVGAGAAARSVARDTTYTVRVDGISGDGIPSYHEFEVTLINPDQLSSDQTIAGSSRPPANLGTSYSFPRPDGAESLRISCFKQSSANWTENAENGNKAPVIDGTTGNYGLIASADSFPGFGAISGRYSFHLTFPTSYDLIALGVPEQTFELDRSLIPKSNAKLGFLIRRGFMTKASNLAVEFSSDDGLIWKALGAPIKGLSDTNFDKQASKVSMSLPPSLKPIRVRFRYHTTDGAIYVHAAGSPTGIFIDEIKCSNCDWLELKKANTVSIKSGNFIFKSATAGAKLVKSQKWLLRLDTKLGGRWFHGPVKPLTIGAVR